jgi:hypothetical protein
VTLLAFFVSVAALVLAVSLRVILRKRYKQGVPGMRQLDRALHGTPARNEWWPFAHWFRRTKRRD